MKGLKEDYKSIIKFGKQYLQPNPGLRIEEAVLDKLDVDKKNKVSKTPIGAFGDMLIVTGSNLGVENPLGAALKATGNVERVIGESWLQFVTFTDL